MPAKIEEKFRKFCKELKSKENRLCYFLGGTADAATGQIITNSFIILIKFYLLIIYLSHDFFIYNVLKCMEFPGLFYVYD